MRALSLILLAFTVSCAVDAADSDPADSDPADGAADDDLTAAAVAGASQGRLRRSESLQMYGASIPDLFTARAFAASHDYVSVNPGGNKIYPYADDMVAANPDLLIALYEKSVHYSGPLDDPAAPHRMPEAWFAHSARPGTAANRVHPPGYPSVDIMQPDSPGSWTDVDGLIGPAGAVYRGWSAFHVQYVRHDLATENARYPTDPIRGVWLDSAGAFSLQGQVNPATGTPYTAPTWLPLVNAAVEDVRDGLPSVSVFANGIDSNPLLVDHVDGLMFENWLRAPTASLASWPTDARWRGDVQRIMDGQLTGATTEVLVKTWAPGSPADLERWRRFAVASYFLADLAHSLFELSRAPGDAPWSYAGGPSYAVNLGAPLDTRAQATGYRVRYLDPAHPANGALYRRRYTDGLVLVNTAAAAMTTSLDRTTYRQLDGSHAPTSFSVPAHTGVLLTIQH